MSRPVTIAINDAAFETLCRDAESAGMMPAERLLASVARQLKGMRRENSADIAARQPFERLTGAVDLGAPTGADTAAMDEGLCGDYSATHEGT